MNQKRMAAYKRDPETRNAAKPYAQKFKGLIELCNQAPANGVTEIVVTWPWVLGDSYEEIVESLARISDAHLALHVVQRGQPPSANIASN
jgi:hypothetical protein